MERNKVFDKKTHNRIWMRNWYRRVIKPITMQRIFKRNIKVILDILLKIERCDICGEIYLPHGYLDKKKYSKSRFCSRKCQHISQKIEFSDGRFSGKNNPFYGKSHKKESIQKMVRNLPNRKLEKHHNWKGGVSFEKYSTSWNENLKSSIRLRDGYKCMICGVPEIECNRNLHIHHIDYDKKNMQSENLISLCMSCHMKTNYKREFWNHYLKQVKERNKNVVPLQK